MRPSTVSKYTEQHSDTGVPRQPAGSPASAGMPATAARTAMAALYVFPSSSVAASSSQHAQLAHLATLPSRGLVAGAHQRQPRPEDRSRNRPHSGPRVDEGAGRPRPCHHDCPYSCQHPGTATSPYAACFRPIRAPGFRDTHSADDVHVPEGCLQISTEPDIRRTLAARAAGAGPGRLAGDAMVQHAPKITTAQELRRDIDWRKPGIDTPRWFVVHWAWEHFREQPETSVSCGNREFCNVCLQRPSTDFTQLE